MDLVALLSSPDTYVSLLVLAVLEIVLGIDNIVFITILAGRLPAERQRGARRIGLGVAMVSRLMLLGAIGFVMKLEKPLFEVLGHGFSGKDLILILGGLFLLAKATHEIYENVERPGEHDPKALEKPGVPAPVDPERIRKLYVSIVLQVLALDMVFSIDSVITAVGLVKRPSMAESIAIMATAMIIAVGVMLAFAGPIGDFIQRHASLRVLALAFLVLIGFLLITEGFHQHVNKGFVYFSMGFSLVVELLNQRMKSRSQRIAEHIGDVKAA